MSKSRNAPSSKPTISAPRIAVAIMAAGKGTRLKSQLAKVLHEVGGKPLLTRVISAAAHVVPPADIFVIIGHEAERVRSVVAHTGVNFILQTEQRGTGHALMVAQPALSTSDHAPDHRPPAEFPPRPAGRDDLAQRRPRPSNRLRPRHSQKPPQH